LFYGEAAQVSRGNTSGKPLDHGRTNGIDIGRNEYDLKYSQLFLIFYEEER
jgi:hypothetical protein